MMGWDIGEPQRYFEEFVRANLGTPDGENYKGD